MFCYPHGARNDGIEQNQGEELSKSNLTHGFQVLYFEVSLEKIWYIYIFTITKIDNLVIKLVVGIYYLTIHVIHIDGCTSLQKLKTAISQNDKSVT